MGEAVGNNVWMGVHHDTPTSGTAVEFNDLAEVTVQEGQLANSTQQQVAVTSSEEIEEDHTVCHSRSSCTN